MFNSEGTIKACINSVLNQTFEGLIEIIVINDGSNDNSKLLVEKIIKESSKKIDIKLINKENGGVSSARNCGMALAKGDYIALLDSDDEWLPEKLEKQLNVFNCDKSIGFIGGLIYTSSNKKKKISEIPLSKLIFKNYFQPSTVIFKKEVIKKIGFFDETQRYAEEGNYFMRIANEFRCILLNTKVVNYSQGKIGFGVSGLSANLKEMEIGELRNLKFAYQSNYISFFTYFLATLFSIIKYFRRILIVKLRQLCIKDIHY
jgi:glycosyltransferase involved in cell wall biosynthesis